MLCDSCSIEPEIASEAKKEEPICILLFFLSYRMSLLVKKICLYFSPWAMSPALTKIKEGFSDLFFVSDIEANCSCRVYKEGLIEKSSIKHLKCPVLLCFTGIK